MMIGGGNKSITMTSSRPYIVKALHEWIVDNNLTPYLLVNAEAPNVMVPQQYVDNGRIVLNVSPVAVNILNIDLESVAFEARFRGIVESVYVPMYAVMAIYAKENGRGMAFDEEDHTPPTPPPTSPQPESKRPKLVTSNKQGGKGKGGHLKVVK